MLNLKKKLNNNIKYNIIMLLEYIYNNIKIFAKAYPKQEKRNIAN